MAQPLIWQELGDGETFLDPMTASKLFFSDYLQFAATAEETGTVPEQLDRMSDLFKAEAQRSMNRLTSIYSDVGWACRELGAIQSSIV